MHVEKGMLRSIILAALTFGLVMGASMIKLSDVGNAVGGASDLAQWTQIILLFSCAWIFPRYSLSTFRLAVFACVSLAATLGAEYVFLVLAPEAVLFDGILSPRGVFALLQGVMECAFTFVCAHLFACLPPKHSSVAVSLGLVINMVVLCLQSLLTTPQITQLRVALLVAGAVCALLGSVWLERGGGAGLSGGVSLAARGRGAVCDVGAWTPVCLRDGKVHARGGDGRIAAFVLFAACAATFAALYGFLGRSALHYELAADVRNLGGQLVLVAVALVLCVYSWLRGITVRGDRVVYALAPLFALAFVVVALASQRGLFAAEVLAGAGYTLLRLLLWTTMARLVHFDPTRLCVYVVLAVFGTTFGSQVGFQVAQALLLGGVEIPLGLSTALAVILCVACCLAVAPGYRRPDVCDDLDTPWLLGDMVGVGRGAPDATGAPDEVTACPSAGEKPASPVGPVGLAVVPGSWANLGAFSAYYGLSRRESQVLKEVLRGYTMAVVAEKTGLSPNTVRTYMRRIYTKSGVDNKQQLIALMESFC